LKNLSVCQNESNYLNGLRLRSDWHK
jgi:hypothetical protein